MKRLICLLFSILSVGAIEAKTLIVGVSPYMNADGHKTQFIKVMKFATGLEVGDKVILIDAYHLKPLGEFILPEGAAYQTPRARLNKNGAVVSAYKNLPETTNKRSAIKPSIQSAIRLPHFMRYLAEYYGQDKTIRDVLIIGSPFFDDPREPAYSMINGSYPNDTHIAASLDQSIFGTKGMGSHLQDWRIHFAYDQQRIINSHHVFFIKRFWTLYIDAMGGALATFATDTDLALKRAWGGAMPSSLHEFTLKPTDELHMLRQRVSNSRVPILDRVLSAHALTDVQIKNAKDVQISATWSCDCDIDLYAKAHRYAEVISFRKPITPMGWYFKDIRKMGKAQSIYESIEFYNPVNLRDVTIALALYSGSPKNGVTGEIRLAVGDQTYAMSYHIPANQGGSTRGVSESFSNGTSTRKHIVMLNALDIVSHRFGGVAGEFHHE